MKVYIITSGQYSDYHIDRVFLDKEKAERYVELSKDRWDDPGIEEWDTDDDKFIGEIRYIEADYRKGCSYNKDSLEVEIKKTNSLDEKEEDVNRNYLWLSTYSGERTIKIKRVLKGDFDEEKLKRRYEKVCYDLMLKVESLLLIEGWTYKMVEEWFNDNLEDYLK